MHPSSNAQLDLPLRLGSCSPLPPPRSAATLWRPAACAPRSRSGRSACPSSAWMPARWTPTTRPCLHWSKPWLMTPVSPACAPQGSTAWCSAACWACSKGGTCYGEVHQGWTGDFSRKLCRSLQPRGACAGGCTGSFQSSWPPCLALRTAQLHHALRRNSPMPMPAACIFCRP